MDGHEIRQYLERIDYAGSTEPTLDVLRALHLAHLRSVPFENLSVRAHEPIVLEERPLIDKIVIGRRGGFCYELNGLFAQLLDGLGFRVERLAGRVGLDGIPFDHMALAVRLEEVWLADVGFGDSFLSPLRLEGPGPQDGGDGRRYRLDRENETLSLMRQEADAWRRQYSFTLTSWPLAAFAEGCRYHQTSPRSHFTQNTIVSRATETGRVTLSNRRLIVTDLSGRHEDILDDQAAAKALATHFGIHFERVP